MLDAYPGTKIKIVKLVLQDIILIHKEYVHLFLIIATHGILKTEDVYRATVVIF
jgi:hypothetical protein